MNFKQQTFITEYLRHRSAFTAYCLAYNIQDQSKYDSIMSAANRLLNHPEVSSVIQSVLNNIRQEVEQEIRAELKTELLTIQKKRELLAKIATGEAYAVKNYKGKDCSQCTQIVHPTITQMLRAIDLDNKMAGHYPTSGKTETVHITPQSQQIATTQEEIHPSPSDISNKFLTQQPIQIATSRTKKSSPTFQGRENCKQRTADCNSGVVISRKKKSTVKKQNITNSQPETNNKPLFSPPRKVYLT